MKTLSLGAALSLFTSLTVFAHEGGHHPTVTDSGRYGGLVTAITEKPSHHDHHDHHDHDHTDETTSKFKAELVRSTDHTVHLYIYTETMTPADPKSLGNEVKSSLVQGASKKTKKEGFSLKFDGKSYKGSSPAVVHKPYSMEFTILINGKENQATFSNLD